MINTRRTQGLLSFFILLHSQTAVSAQLQNELLMTWGSLFKTVAPVDWDLTQPALYCAPQTVRVPAPSESPLMESLIVQIGLWPIQVELESVKLSQTHVSLGDSKQRQIRRPFLDLCIFIWENSEKQVNVTFRNFKHVRCFHCLDFSPA